MNIQDFQPNNEEEKEFVEQYSELSIATSKIIKSLPNKEQALRRLAG